MKLIDQDWSYIIEDNKKIAKEMTLPDERYRAVLLAKHLLEDLLDSKKTPRIPKAIRQRAYSALRHYPSTWDMERAARACPEVFQERMEPVTKLFKQYERSKVERNES